jgi:peptidoglycan/xylan/chitin deacetylase (PgdA/CDA1 family)
MKKTSVIISLIIVFAVFLTVLASCDTNTSQKPEPSGQGGYDIETTNESTKSPSTTSEYTKEDKLIALTFDDGPNSASTNKILDILEENNSVGTFFVVGYNIEKNAETIKRASDMGCEIGNHSDGHKNLTKCTESELREQVDNANKKLKDITGISPTLFRVLGGNYQGVEADSGMPLIQWNIDTEDWKYKDNAHPERTAEEREEKLKSIADRVIAEAKSGDIILLHDIYNFTADLTDLIVKGLVEQGFKLVTVSEMFDAFGEELENGIVYRSANQPAVNAAVALGNYIIASKYDSVNVRLEPSLDSDILTSIPNRTAVTVKKSVTKWAYVEFEGGSGWISSAFLFK